MKQESLILFCNPKFRHNYAKQLPLWLSNADQLNGSQISLKKQEHIAFGCYLFLTFSLLVDLWTVQFVSYLTSTAFQEGSCTFMMIQPQYFEPLLQAKIYLHFVC